MAVIFFAWIDFIKVACEKVLENLKKIGVIGQNCWMTKSQQIYPTDLNDTQWLKIRPDLPTEAATGRPREHGWRVILNGIFYILQSGCSWRMLPSDLPPWQTVYYYFWL